MRHWGLCLYYKDRIDNFWKIVNSSSCLIANQPLRCTTQPPMLWKAKNGGLKAHSLKMQRCCENKVWKNMTQNREKYTYIRRLKVKGVGRKEEMCWRYKMQIVRKKGAECLRHWRRKKAGMETTDMRREKKKKNSLNIWVAWMEMVGKRAVLFFIFLKSTHLTCKWWHNM